MLGPLVSDVVFARDQSLSGTAFSRILLRSDQMFAVKNVVVALSASLASISDAALS